MKHLLRRFTGFLCALALAAALCSCGGGANSFTWFVEQIPANLDPQVALDPADVIACTNLYSGLVRRTPEGELAPALAESWEVSADGLRYTFTLRQGLYYTATKGAQTEYAITAQDFVFAFQRIFMAETGSPYAVEFAAIQNSAPVLAGQLSPAQLGVKAVSDSTLVFRLSERDENFLAKLALPGAMPCDEEFFTGTRGTYGLKASSTLSSGSFYLYNWTSGGLFLRRTPSGSQVDSLRLVQNTNALDQSAEELILNERCSAAPDETAAPTSLRSVPYSDTTWGLVFQCGEGSVFSSPLLRQALIASAREAELDLDSPLYPTARGLVPEGLTVDGLDYRALAGDPSPRFGPARSLYMEARQGMSNSDFAKVTLLLPAGCGLEEAAGQINSQWQKQLALYFSVEQVEMEEFTKRMAQGAYTIALAPVQAEGGSVYEMLLQFTPEGGGLGGYSDPAFAADLAASARATGRDRCQLLAQCERRLLEDGVFAPLFAQQKRLLLADGVEGLVFDPFGPVLDLTYTTKTKS